MKKFFQSLQTSPVIIVLLIVIFLFLPQSITRSPESTRNAIITTVGIDKVGEEFEISLLSFIPKAGKEFVEVYEIISTKKSSLSEAFNEAELQLGKDVKLFHTEVIVIGADALQEDVSKMLDFFTREESASSSCMLIGTNKTAKEFLEFLQEKDENPSNKLSEIMLYNSNHLYSQDVSIESFYNGYFGPTKTSSIAYLTLVENASNEILLNTTKEAGSSSNSSNENQNKNIENTGEVALFKGGKFIEILDKEIVSGLNWTNVKNNKKSIVLENFSDGEINNAKVIYYLDKKDIIKSVSFKNGVPVYMPSIRLHIDRIEIYGDKKDEKENIYLFNLNEESVKRIQFEVKKQYSNAINKLRETKTDLLGVYRDFYTKDRRNFLKFLDSLSDKDDFLNYVVFNLNIELLTD